MCLHTGSADNGSSIQLWKCGNGTSMDKQWYVPSSGIGPIRWNAHPTKCINVAGGRNASGTNANLWDCGDGAHADMQWTLKTVWNLAKGRTPQVSSRCRLNTRGSYLTDLDTRVNTNVDKNYWHSCISPSRWCTCGSNDPEPFAEVPLASMSAVLDVRIWTRCQSNCPTCKFQTYYAKAYVSADGSNWDACEGESGGVDGCSAYVFRCKGLIGTRVKVERKSPAFSIAELQIMGHRVISSSTTSNSVVTSTA